MEEGAQSASLQIGVVLILTHCQNPKKVKYYITDL